MHLQMEQRKFMAEFDKIPENSRTIAQRRRKQDLERELGIVGKNISNLRNKLRELGALK